jgi:hypothetical protein
MPRILEGDDSPVPEKVEPRTAILREGLDASKTYLINEEEVTRAGKTPTLS